MQKLGQPAFHYPWKSMENVGYEQEIKLSVKATMLFFYVQGEWYSPNTLRVVCCFSDLAL